MKGAVVPICSRSLPHLSSSIHPFFSLHDSFFVPIFRFLSLPIHSISVLVASVVPAVPVYSAYIVPYLS